MVLVVLANLFLILFDLTYLWLRPYYFNKFPKLLQIYDKPVLGIEAHRSTEKYLHYIDTLKYLEEIKNTEKFEEEFEKTLTNLKDHIRSINSFDDSRLESEKNTLLEKYNKIQKPSDISQELLDAEELFLDILSFKEMFNETMKLETLESDLLLLTRVQTEKGWKIEKESILSQMDYQIIHIIETNPFQASGQTENLTKIKSNVKTRYDSHKTRAIDKKFRDILVNSLGGQKSFPSTALAFTWFWRNDSSTMKEKFSIFDKEMRNLMGVNYFRHIGKNGKPVYNYLMMDAPFLAFFLCEFAISWIISIRKRKYIAWFLYPLYHWYDVLGLLPIVELRLFRLIRIYKISLILKTNRIIPIGDDIISRTLRYYGNIIKEEISDMVTIQILTESQEEIRSGSSLHILTNAIDAHRTGIKSITIRKLQEIASNERLGTLVEQTISEIIERSDIASSQFPFLPKTWKDNLAKEISSIIYRAISQAVLNSLEEESGRKSIENLVDFIIDEMEATAQDSEVNALNNGITLELLENIKKSVASKKWLKSKI
jgi:hypothetical protein